MKIKTWIKYEESYLPPRCRKLRYRECEDYVDIDYAETTADNLRLAFEDNSYEGQGKIFLYSNELWTKAKIADVCGSRDTDKYATPLGALIYWREHSSWFFPHLWRDGEHPNKEHMISVAIEESKKYLIVDGELYKVTSEPRYEILTFGLGHNHGGTGMFCSYYYNSNISKNSYFSALQGEQAVEYANKVAAARGDTNDVGKFKPFIICHMPELVKVNPQEQHGDGDGFMNDLEGVIESSDSAMEAGLLCMAMSMTRL